MAQRKKAAVIGSFVVDLMARAPHLPQPGETVRGSYFKAGPGGKGSNQAIAAKRAGCDLVFATKLGRDAFAQIALDAYRQEGMDTRYVFQTDKAETGSALITVAQDTAQNEIVVVPGACECFDRQDMDCLRGAIKGCDYLLMQLEINPWATQTLIEMAWEEGVRVILNPAPVQPIPLELYPKLWLMTPNEVEAQALTGHACDDLAGCRRAAQVLLDKGVAQVMITLGSRGMYATDGHKEFTLSNYPVSVVDTTGAGDAFNGGLLAGLSLGMNLRQAAAYGNVTANLCVTRLGTAPAMPTGQELRQFLQAHDPALLAFLI